MRRTLAVLLVFLLLLSLGATQVFAEDGMAGDEGCPTEGEEPEEEFGNKYLWRIAHLEAIARRVPFGFGLTRAIANAHRQLQRAVEQGRVAPVEGDESTPDGDIVIIIDEEPENDEGNGEGENDEAENCEEEVYADKYLWRIAHLTAIAEGAPEGARFGLERAMANAHRQRQKALEQGRIVEDDEGEEDGNGEEVVEISGSGKGSPARPGGPAKPGGPPGFVKKK